MSSITFAVVVVLLALSALVVFLVLRHRRRSRISAPWPIPEASQHVVVLAHGLLGFEHLKVLGTRHHYFRGIANHLRSQGAAVQVSEVPPLGTVPERAEALARYVRELDEKRVLIIGHSMGGLDARYAIRELGLAPQVSGLVTVATPHRGSCLADAASLAPAKVLRGLVGRAGVTTDALDWLGESVAKSFNDDIQNVSDVFYGCVVGETTRSRVMGNPLLLACFEVLSKMRGPNDGLVPASSQRWGEVLQVVPAHHFGQIGWSPLFDANRMFMQLLLGLHASGFACLPSTTQVPAVPETESPASFS